LPTPAEQEAAAAAAAATEEAGEDTGDEVATLVEAVMVVDNKAEEVMADSKVVAAVIVEEVMVAKVAEATSKAAPTAAIEPKRLAFDRRRGRVLTIISSPDKNFTSHVFLYHAFP